MSTVLNSCRCTGSREWPSIWLRDEVILLLSGKLLTTSSFDWPLSLYLVIKSSTSWDWDSSISIIWTGSFFKFKAVIGNKGGSCPKFLTLISECCKSWARLKPCVVDAKTRWLVSNCFSSCCTFKSSVVCSNFFFYDRFFFFFFFLAMTMELSVRFSSNSAMIFCRASSTSL